MASSSLILPEHAHLVITEQKQKQHGKYESSGIQPPEAGLM